MCVTFHKNKIIQGENGFHIKNNQHLSAKIYNHDYGGYKEYYRLLFLKTGHLMGRGVRMKGSLKFKWYKKLSNNTKHKLGGSAWSHMTKWQTSSMTDGQGLKCSGKVSEEVGQEPGLSSSYDYRTWTSVKGCLSRWEATRHWGGN